MSDVIEGLMALLTEQRNELTAQLDLLDRLEHFIHDQVDMGFRVDVVQRSGPPSLVIDLRIVVSDADPVPHLASDSAPPIEGLPNFLSPVSKQTIVDHLRALDDAEAEAEATGAHYTPGPRQAAAAIPQVSPDAKTGAPQAVAEGEDWGGSDAAPVEDVPPAVPARRTHDERLTADPEPAAEPAPVQSRSGLPWDECEDDEIVETVAANRVSRAMGYNEIMAMIAARIGRTASTVGNRASSVLKDRIMLREVALRREAGPVADPEPASSPIPEPVAADVPVAIAEPEATPRVEIVPPAPLFQTGQPLWWREIEDRLNRIGNPSPFTLAIDLALLEQLAKGHKLGWVSTDLGIDLAALKARFAKLVPEPGIAAQDRVMQVLRARADRKAA